MEEAPKAPEEQQAPETGGENYVNKDQAWEMAKAEDPHRERAKIMETLGLDSSKVINKSEAAAEAAGDNYRVARMEVEKLVKNLFEGYGNMANLLIEDKRREQDYETAMKDFLLDDQGKEKVPGLTYNFSEMQTDQMGDRKKAEELENRGIKSVVYLRVEYQKP